MPLADFQSALGTLVATFACAQELPASWQPLHISPAEVEWLQSLPHTPGFRVTCTIQRWWRETRLRERARLTIAALGTAQASPMIADYLHANLCTSLFFLPETLAFLRFVEDKSEHLHVIALAQFERALLLAQEEAAQPLANRSAAVTQIAFAAPPTELLAALLHRQALPEPGARRFPVIVSAALPHYWCEVSGGEA